MTAGGTPRSRPEGAGRGMGSWSEAERGTASAGQLKSAGRGSIPRVGWFVASSGLLGLVAIGAVQQVHQGLHEHDELPPMLHWLRDTAIAVPLAPLAIWAAALLVQQSITRLGRGSRRSELLPWLIWAGLAALLFALLSIPGNQLHGLLFGAEEEEIGWLEDALTPVSVPAARLRSEAALNGKPPLIDVKSHRHALHAWIRGRGQPNGRDAPRRMLPVRVATQCTHAGMPKGLVPRGPAGAPAGLARLVASPRSVHAWSGYGRALRCRQLAPVNQRRQATGQSSSRQSTSATKPSARQPAPGAGS